MIWNWSKLSTCHFLKPVCLLLSTTDALQYSFDDGKKHTRRLLLSYVVVHLGSRALVLYFVPCHKPCPSIRPRGSSLFVAAWTKSSHPRISQWVNTDMLRVSLNWFRITLQFNEFLITQHQLTMYPNKFCMGYNQKLTLHFWLLWALEVLFPFTRILKFFTYAS